MIRTCEVVAEVQKAAPPTIEFRAAPDNGSSDGWDFAPLLREEWRALESLDCSLMQQMYQPLATRRRA